MAEQEDMDFGYDETTPCPLCKKEISIGVFTFHLVSCCYKQFKRSGLPTPCTCPIHKGEAYHDWSINNNNNNNNNNNSTSSSSSSSSSRRTIPLPSPAPHSNPDILDVPPVTSQLLGECCFGCGSTKSNFIKGKLQLGAYRLIRLCKQSEMKETSSRAIIAKWLEAEVKKCRDTNDSRPTFNPKESPNDPDPAGITTNHHCAGYVHNDTDTVCGQTCDSVISFTETTSRGVTTTLYFCSIVHFLRWYVKHRTGKSSDKRRKTSGNKGKGKGKRASRESEESEEDTSETDA
eukprot:TRINITY_DN73_c0_g2_i2.p1 TRINITY_DN73_c0_g2~~TRINITY_DN73_c0_g2_i2.p1  ORF type:complete len:307 (-),score=48.52 TRINITY_DN73_c0_g2_i2:40-909(-)